MIFEYTATEFLTKARELGIPAPCAEGLTAHVYDGRPVGHFLTAVLENNLKEACSRADLDNRRCLYEYVFLLYNYAPAGCWGAPGKARDWRAERAAEREMGVRYRLHDRTPEQEA